MNDLLEISPGHLMIPQGAITDLSVFKQKLVEAKHSTPDAGVIDLVEQVMLQIPQLDIPLNHIFSPGLYAREMLVPAGVLLTGKVHKHKHLVIISKGDISFYTDGKFVRRVQAPATFVSEPGDRRMGYTHSETVWTTIHPTNETDVDKLELELFEPHPLEKTLKENTIKCLQ